MLYEEPGELPQVQIHLNILRGKRDQNTPLRGMHCRAKGNVKEIQLADRKIIVAYDMFLSSLHFCLC